MEYNRCVLTPICEKPFEEGDKCTFFEPSKKNQDKCAHLGRNRYCKSKDAQEQAGEDYNA